MLLSCWYRVRVDSKTHDEQVLQGRSVMKTPYKAQTMTSRELVNKLVRLAGAHTFDTVAFGEVVDAFNELWDENRELKKMIHIKGKDLEVNFYQLYD